MSEYKIEVNRPLVGVLALICLTAWIGIWVVWPNHEDWKLWQAGFMRVGLVMSAFWVALPSRNRPAAWNRVSPTAFIGLLLAVVGIVLRPKLMIPLLLVLAVVGYVLRPRQQGPRMKPRPGRRRRARHDVASQQEPSRVSNADSASDARSASDTKRTRLTSPASSGKAPPAGE